MADFVVRLYSPSVIRLCPKPYDEDGGRRVLFLGLPHAHVAVFDNFKEVADDVRAPDGLIIQAKFAASDVDSAIDNSIGVAGHVLSMMSCVAMASADSPIPIWAYDESNGVENREYRYCFYEGTGARATRPLNDQHMTHLLEKNYNSFLANCEIKDDFKQRIQRALIAFRRGLSDNDDVLNEFLTAWSTMEGLDCVYCKLLPSASVRRFKDGMKDVLSRLGRPEVFAPLESLRNDIAHGSLSLAQGTQMAVNHVELIRQALVMMILRILNADEATIKLISSQTSYKGKIHPHVRFMAKIQFDPVEVQNLDGQPQVKVWIEGKTFTKNEQTLGFEPDIRFQPLNLKQLSAYGMQAWGDIGAPIRVGEMGVKVIPKGDDGQGEKPAT